MSELTFIVLAVIYNVATLIIFCVVVAVVEEFSERYLPKPLSPFVSVGTATACGLGLLGMILAIGMAEC